MKVPTTLDPRDRILQGHTPAIMMPRYGTLAPLEKPGHRFIVAEDGVWLEAHRPWIHVRALLAPAHEEHRMPFGRIAEDLGYGGRELDAKYAFTNEDMQRVCSLFLYDARRAMPDEFAAWAVWDERTRRLFYRAMVAREASPGGITFNRPQLEDHEHLAIDLHSHGTMEAFFSATDDADDRGEIKLSIVAGTLDGERATFAKRLCVLGLFIQDEEH